MAGNAGKGRPKGALNHATRDIKAAAQKHGPAAIAELVRVMKQGASEQTRVAAARELLDRGYGKATQPIEGPGEDGAFDVIHTIKLIAAGNGGS